MFLLEIVLSLMSKDVIDITDRGRLEEVEKLKEFLSYMFIL
jgi:hypothetical protein